jgi:hypothetical protein
MLMGCIIKMTLLLESSYFSNVHGNILDWAYQLMYDCDQLLIAISSSIMVTMFGMGARPSKLWWNLRCMMVLL